MTLPILYSFRRCPYAMRARLAIASAGITCELREIVLRDKAPEFLTASPKGTVPVVVTGGTVLEESLDVMHWALGKNDPEGWLNVPQEAHSLIAEADGPFKSALDRTKYATRYKDADPSVEREKASVFLRKLDMMLVEQLYLFGESPSIADMAIAPFVRQFANIDKDWFDAQPWPNLIEWLERFLSSERFTAIMKRNPKWQAGDQVVLFP